MFEMLLCYAYCVYLVLDPADLFSTCLLPGAEYTDLSSSIVLSQPLCEVGETERENHLTWPKVTQGDLQQSGDLNPTQLDPSPAL